MCYLFCIGFSYLIFLLLDLLARMLAYVNVMFVIIDFIGELRIVLSSYFRERCYLHQLTRQVHFDHVFHTYIFIVFSVILATTSPVVILILVVG